MTSVHRSTIKLEVKRAYVNMRFCFKSACECKFFVLFTIPLSFP